MKQIVVHPEIGAIEFNIRRNVRGIHFSVSANRVSISCSPRNAKSVFPLSAERVAWIIQSQEQLVKRAAETALIIAPTTTLQTNQFLITTQENKLLKVPFSSELRDQQLIIYYRDAQELQSASGQQKVKMLIAHYLQQAAHALLPNRLQKLAQMYGFQFNNVRINSAQTRWGSCSGRKDINLSYNIMLLPDELVDFVLVHELCHTRVMNHGPRFVQLMKSIFSDYDARQKALKNYHTLHI